MSQKNLTGLSALLKRKGSAHEGDAGVKAAGRAAEALTLALNRLGNSTKLQNERSETPEGPWEIA